MAKEIDKIAVGERIKQIRLEMGYTLGEFSDVFRTTRSNVNHWEKGRSIPRPRTLSEIAFQGQISVDELLHGKQELTIDPMILFNQQNDIRKYLSLHVKDEAMTWLDSEFSIDSFTLELVISNTDIYVNMDDLPEEITITKGE